MYPLTNSEMASFLNCRRGWYIRYYRRLARLTHSSLPTIGTMYHHGLERYYSTGDTEVAGMIRAEGAELLEQFPDSADRILKDVEYAAIMLEGYFEWLEETGADIGLSVIGAERTVEVPLEGTPYTLRGKIDAQLRRDVDGALLQLEHKTTGNLTDIPRYAQSAPQFLTYDLLAFLDAKRGEGQATDGVIVNMAKRVKRTQKATPPFYGRHEVRHNLDELRAHWKHVVRLGYEIDDTRKALDQGASHHTVCPPNVSRNHTFTCDCASITAMFDDGSDVEGFLAEAYEEHDPYERYADEEVA